MDTARIRARDAAARRLRRLTAAFVAAFSALALLFALVAEKAFPGRSSHVNRPATVQHRARVAATKRTAQTAPTLVQIGSQASPAPASPSPAPAPTAAPPAVVSGGT